MISIQVLFHFWLLAFTLNLAAAQMQYDPDTNLLSCSKPGGNYCAQASLKGSTMISCASSELAEIRSCNVELARILPGGFENSSNAGDAVCAFNGTGYTLAGLEVDIPETILCDSVKTKAKGNVLLAGRSNNDGEIKTMGSVQPVTGGSSLQLVKSSVTTTLPRSTVPKSICSNPWPSNNEKPVTTTTTNKAANNLHMLPAPMYLMVTSSSYQAISSKTTTAIHSSISQYTSDTSDDSSYTTVTGYVTEYEPSEPTSGFTQTAATHKPAETSTSAPSKNDASMPSSGIWENMNMFTWLFILLCFVKGLVRATEMDFEN